MSTLTHYKILRPLGSGSFAKVVRNFHSVAEHNITKKKVAIKIIKRTHVQDEKSLRKIEREIKILQGFHHPHIIRLYEFIETEREIFLVMEYVPGGELYSLIERNGRIPEKQAREYFQQVISALSYCHERKVVHRDIKPENILIDEQSFLKLGDFGLSNFIKDGIFLKTSCGSPNYAAPEIISGEQYCGPQVDVWSAGVLLYTLLAALLPFDENNISALFAKIKAGRFNIPHYFSIGARDLIRRMLNTDPVSRITIKQIMEHPWYKANIPLHLKYTEAIVDNGGIVDCLGAMQANRSRKEICEEILNKCLEYPEFQSLGKDELRRQIVAKKQDPFTVTYHILLDSTLKVKRNLLNQSEIDVQPIFQKKIGIFMIPDDETIVSSDCTSSTESEKSSHPIPHNWVFGFRCAVSPIKLVIHLFESLKSLNMEWKFLSEFEIRVRTVGFEEKKLNDEQKMCEDGQECTGKGVKFDIQIYKFNETFILDVKKVDGIEMVYLDICAKLYKKLNGSVPIVRKRSIDIY